MDKFTDVSKAVQRHSAWVVPFYRPNRTILIAKRSNIVNNPKLWNLFGGNVDGDDSPLKTARKEFREEAGIKIPRKALISLGKTTTSIKGAKFFMHYFVFEANHEFRPILNNENSKSKWVPIDEIEDWMHSAKAHRSLRNFKHVLDGMLEKDAKEKAPKSEKEEDKGEKTKSKYKEK